MKLIFYHIALDRFGAECVGQFHRQAGDHGLTAGADGGIECEYRCLWGGLSAPPVETVLLDDRRLPDWGVEGNPNPFPPMAGPELVNDMRLDRSVLARKTAESLVVTAEGSLGHRLRWLLQQYPVQVTGNVAECEVRLTLSASLADPAASALLLGWLRGLELMRLRGETVPVAHVVAAIGSDSRDQGKEPDPDPLLPRAMAARALFDLQGYMGQGLSSARMAPIYLLGDRPPGDKGRPLDRTSQAALGGDVLLGIVLAELHPEERDRDCPFWVRIGRQDIHWGGRKQDQDDPYDPRRPLAACGGFAVQFPAMRLARVLSMRFFRDLFRRLAAQPPARPLRTEPADASASAGDATGGDRLTPEQTTFVHGLADAAAQETSRRLGEQGREAAAAAASGWPTWDQLELAIGKIEDDPVWRRLFALYGEERLFAVPLDDWDIALREFETLVEDGFVSRRKRSLAGFPLRLAGAVHASVLGSVRMALAAPLRTPALELLPNRLAAETVRECHAKIGEIVRTREDRAVRTRGAEEDVAEIRASLGAIRKRVLDDAAAVPSPVAVWLRAGLLLTALCGLALAVPVPDTLGLVAFAPIRFLVGLVVGACLLGWLVVRAYRAKKILMEGVREWLSQYSTVLEAEDELRRSQVLTKALDMAGRHLLWMSDGTHPVDGLEFLEPASHISLSALTRAAPDADPVRRPSLEPQRDICLTAFLLQPVSTEVMRVASTVPGVKGDVAATVKQFIAGGGVLANATGPVDPTLAEALFAYRNRYDGWAACFELLEQTMVARYQETRLEECLPAVTPDHPAVVEDEYQRIKTAAASKGCSPLAVLCKDVIEELRLGLPAPDAVAGDQLAILAARRFWLGRVTGRPLKEWLRASSEDMRGVGLADAVRHYSEVTIVTTPPAAQKTMLIASDLSDPLANAIRPAASQPNELGRGGITLWLRVGLGLSAEDIVFYPNKEQAGELGRGFQILGAKGDLPALKPCVAEDDPNAK